MLAGRPAACPVPDGVQICRLGLRSQLRGVLGHLPRRAVHASEALVGAGGFGGAYNAPRFVDPDSLRNVDHAVEIGEAMLAVDQGRVGRPAASIQGSASTSRLSMATAMTTKFSPASSS